MKLSIKRAQNNASTSSAEREKFGTKFKALKLFSMAALTLMVGACSQDVIEQAPQDKGIHFEATISPADGSGATRTTYTTDGTNINVSWKVGDQIALLHNGTKDVAEVKSVATDGKATIACDFATTPADGEEVRLIYPAASVNSSGAGTGYTPIPAYAAKGLAQDGTLDYIAANLDSRQSTGAPTLAVSGDKATLASDVTMQSNICIWELNLTTDGTTPLNATQLTLKLGGQAIAQAASAGSSQYYMCVVPETLTKIYASLPTAPFAVEASDGTDTYLYSLTGGTQLTLATSKYYNSTLTMPKEGNLYNIVASGTINGSPVDGELLKQKLPAATNITTLLGGAGASITVNTVSVKSGSNITIDAVDGSSITVTDAGTAVLTVNYSLGMGNNDEDITVIVSKMPVAIGKSLADAVFSDVLCSDSKFYNSSDLDNLPGGVTQVALVAYKSGSNGLAIALADIPEGDYFSGSTNCSALNTAMPITGAIWGMPSKYDWQNMIDAYSYIGGWTAFKAAAKLADHEYWTSTDEMPNTYNVLGTDGDMTMTADGSSATKYSRAVLSW